MLGLAVTTYMLILAWNEDYGSGRVATDAVTTTAAPATTDGIDNLLPGMDADASPAVATENTAEILPTDELLPAGNSQTDSSVDPVALGTSNRYITVSTDVLNITIDTVGGDIVTASLVKFPVTIDQPDEPFVLMDPRKDRKSVV